MKAETWKGPANLNLSGKGDKTNRGKGPYHWRCCGSITAALKGTVSFRVSFLPPLLQNSVSLL